MTELLMKLGEYKNSYDNLWKYIIQPARKNVPDNFYDREIDYL